MANAGLIAGINRKQVPDNVNLFVLPSFHAPQHNRTRECYPEVMRFVCMLQEYFPITLHYIRRRE